MKRAMSFESRKSHALAASFRSLATFRPPVSLARPCPPRPTWQLRVLLGDADREARHARARLLRQDGHEVLEVRDGASLLDKMASTILDERLAPFDVIVAAHRLPGVTGLSVLTGLRQVDWLTPFILLTDADDGALDFEARRLGAMLLRRSIDDDAFRAAVNAIDSAIDRAPSRA